jgi:hypothetical protein
VHDDSSSGGLSNKPTRDECRRCGKMGHWARECRSKPKKEWVHVSQNDEEGSLLLVMAILTRPWVSSTPRSEVEAISSEAEIVLKEEKVYAHLNKEKECDVGTWVIDTGATNHRSGCWAAFMKLDTAVLDIVHFSDDSVAQIEGHWTVMFVCKNGRYRSLEWVYFIPRLTTNIMRIGLLDEDNQYWVSV